MHVAFFLSHYPSPGGTTTAVDGLASSLELCADPDRFPVLGFSGRRYVDANLRWDRLAPQAQLEYQRPVGSGTVA